MWSSFYLLVNFVILQQSHASRKNLTGCYLESACLKCGPPGCIKCPSLILYPSRKCIDACPSGHKLKWSNLSDYMGQMCVYNGHFMGISPDTASILTGIFLGTILCVFVVISAMIYVRFKKATVPHLIETSSDIDDLPEKRDFVKQLDSLRPYSNKFLDMLNDTRRQLRGLHLGGDNTAAAAYKPVVRDLAKILLLLNRSVEKLAAPDDWEHLFSWAEKVLKRYKRMSEVSQAQVAQLIHFLQAPTLTVQSEVELPQRSTKMSTFKPEHNFGSPLSLSTSLTKIKHFENNETSLISSINPQWQFNYPLLVNNQLPTSEFMPLQWKNSKELLNNYYFLDEDFFQLGLRPQDEITTEL